MRGSTRDQKSATFFACIEEDMEYQMLIAHICVPLTVDTFIHQVSI